MGRIKRCNDELKAERPTLQEVEFIPRLPIFILVENVRSVYNVGSIFRSAEDLEQKRFILLAIPRTPPVKICIKLPWALKM